MKRVMEPIAVEGSVYGKGYFADLSRTTDFFICLDARSASLAGETMGVVPAERLRCNLQHARKVFNSAQVFSSMPSSKTPRVKSTLCRAGFFGDHLNCGIRPGAARGG